MRSLRIDRQKDVVDGFSLRALDRGAVAMQKMPIIRGEFPAIMEQDSTVFDLLHFYDFPVGESLAFLRAVLRTKQQPVVTGNSDLPFVVDPVVLRQFLRV